MPHDHTTPDAPRIDQSRCRRCGRFLPISYTFHRVRLCDLCDSRLAAGAVRAAAEALTVSLGSGVRQGACPFDRLHLNGICQKCVEMAEHDARIAAEWRASLGQVA